jgi:hypothetical protein
MNTEAAAVDPLEMFGIKRTVVDNGDGLVFHATQDVEAILDNNKAEYNNGLRGYTPSRDLRKIAEIPLLVAEDWRNRFGVDVFLNSNEYLYLRTAPGCV